MCKGQDLYIPMKNANTIMSSIKWWWWQIDYRCIGVIVHMSLSSLSSSMMMMMMMMDTKSLPINVFGINHHRLLSIINFDDQSFIKWKKRRKKNSLLNDWLSGLKSSYMCVCVYVMFSMIYYRSNELNCIDSIEWNMAVDKKNRYIHMKLSTSKS